MSNNSNNNSNQNKIKKKRLSNKTVTKLNNMSFKFTDYKRECKHTNVPHHYTKKTLGFWVLAQKKKHKHIEEGKPSSLTKEHTHSLNKLGFVWETHYI